jgi:FkbM family methyltransferase
MTDRLIVDLGMHRGDDTAFYLAKGFRVLAVEANPDLAERGRKRFAREIEQDRLEIRQLAVAERAGTVTFYSGEQDGWGSLSKERAGASLNVDVHQYDVEACTFQDLMKGLTPYYVKVDIEGADLLCVRGVASVPAPPKFFSFECDLTQVEETVEGIRGLAGAGYERFMLVNQALNPAVKCPNPPLEGAYVDTRFTHDMSGPFGEEAPGEWSSLDEVIDRFTRVAHQQAARASYAETGKVLGIPIGRLHGVLKAFYNAPPVRFTRTRWAQARGAEVGGWFDLHAAR